MLYYRKQSYEDQRAQFTQAWQEFNNLKRKFGIPKVSNLKNDDIILNYSYRVLTETEKNVLARGLRFCLPPNDIDRYEVKCSFELLN